MKITIEIDCTPTEARQFLGLPDFEPIHAVVMKEVERRTLAEMDRFSAEGLLKSWLSAFPQNADQIQELVGKMFFRGFNAGKDS